MKQEKVYDIFFLLSSVTIMLLGSLDPCRSQPCQNGAICANKWDRTDYSCSCDTTSFGGKNCGLYRVHQISCAEMNAIVITRVLDQPCTSGRKCLSDGLCQHSFCYCKTGYEVNEEKILWLCSMLYTISSNFVGSEL